MVYEFDKKDGYEYLVSGFECNCGHKILKVIYNDLYLDEFEVKCDKCGKEYTLQKEKSLSWDDVLDLEDD